MFTRSSTAAGLAAVVFLSLASLVTLAAVRAEQPQKSVPAGKAAAAGTEMSEYLVISPHTSQECLAVLDEVAAMGKDALAKCDWGCMSGDHTAYLKIQAKNEAEALKTVPSSVRSKARAVKLNQFSIEDIKKFHESH